MPDETLIAAAEPDRFTHESPIRAFTEFRVAGTWAIGKGFRPSLAHIHTYLDAMQHKEGWHLVQMLDGGSLDPTLIFQRDRIMSFTVPERPTVNTLEDVDVIVEAVVAEVPHKQPNVGDDPINPAYYDGTACAEIIEHMPTNVGIAAKYGWRLGEKDEEVQECGKAAWYLKRELALHDETVDLGHGRAKFGFASPNDADWYRRYADERIDAARTAGKLTPERALFMTHLVSYTITRHVSLLHQAIGFLESPGCFSEYGRGQQP